MKTNIHRLLLTGLLTLTLISCGEETGNEPNTHYIPQNAEINTPTTWKATDNIIVDCILEVNSTLTIEPGSVVKFTGNGYLKIGKTSNAALIANGTAEQPIRFTYNRTDITSVIQRGMWYGVYFGERNLVNTTTLQHCIFEGAGKENTPCIELNKTSLNMTNCSIGICAASGIKAGTSSEFKAFSNNTLSQCDGYLLTGIPEAMLNLDTTNTFLPTNNKGIALQGGYIEFDGTLTTQSIPYTITGNIFVENAELTIEKGNTLAFNDRTSLNIGKETRAALIAVGTSTDPIRFTSSATTPRAGDWEGLIFYPNNQTTVTNLRYVTIEYAGQSVGTLEGAINTSSSINMAYSTIKNSSSYGIYCNDGATISNITNILVSDCGKHPISIHIGQAYSLDSTNVFTNNEYNFIKLRGSQLNGTVRWKKLTIPYLIEEGLVIGNGSVASRLTLSPGCTLCFSFSSSITVNAKGTLTAGGTLQDSIIFTSASENPAPGDWIGIYLGEGSLSNVLSYCSVKYAGEFSNYAVGINTSSASITRNSIQHSALHGFYIFYNNPNNRPFFMLNTFLDIPGENTYLEPAPAL